MERSSKKVNPISIKRERGRGFIVEAEIINKIKIRSESKKLLSLIKVQTKSFFVGILFK